MSEFSDKQKNECEEIKQPPEEIQEEFCPSCIPDPYSPVIDWVNEEDPYFDPRTCEYIANVSFHKSRDVFQNGIEISIIPEENILGLEVKKTFSSLREYAESQKERGTEILLKHFGKKLTKESLSLSFIPEDGIHVSSNSVINLKIVILSERFNAIGELTEEDLEQEQPTNNTTFPDTLTIDDSRFELWEKLITTNLGILAYETRYSYFRSVDDGVIKYDKDGELTFFKPKDIRDSLNDLKLALDKILNANDMSFYSISSFFGIYDTVTEIEIEFDHSDSDKPFKIHKIYATSGNCPRKELVKGLPSFKEKAYLPTALFYMINFEKAYSDITATEPRDWLEFFEEYTYPPIQIVYGSSGSEEKLKESGLSCALDVDLGQLGAGLLEDFFHSAWDIFSDSFDLVACSDEPIDREPALKEFLRPDVQKTYEDVYKQELKRLKKERNRMLLESPDEDNLHDHTEDPKFLSKIAEENRKAEEKLRQEAEQKAEQAVRSMDKKNFLHPFYKHFESSLKERFKNDQEVLQVFKKISKDPRLTESKKIQKFIQSVGMCGVSNGFKKALDCFMKQFDLKALLTSAVKMFLKGFSVQKLSNALRDLLFFLPADKQIEVQIKIEEKLGKIRPPWETFTTNPDEISLKQEQKIAQQVLKDKNGKTLTETVDGKKVPITKGALGASTNIPEEKEEDKEEDKIEGSEFSEGINDALNQSAELILETYLETLLGATTTEELITKYKKEIPAIGEILKAFPTDCKTSPIKDLNMSLLPDYKFDICNPTIPTTFYKLPELKWKPNIWKMLKGNIKKTIREAIMKAITALVMKLVKLLEEKLCDSLAFLGKGGLDLLSGKDVDFGQILKDAFCPDASEDEVRDLGNSLLNKIGAKDTDIQNAFDCFSGAIFGSMTQRELIDLITLKDKNPVDIQMFIQTIKVGCPNMYDLVNTPNKAENFFNNIGNLIPQETRALLQESIPFSGDGVPFYDSICLTSDELRSWDQIRRQGLEGAGLSPEDAANQVDLYNRRARDTLDDIMDIINNGPTNNIDDMIQDLFSPLVDDPCNKKALKEGESLFGNKASREPEELVKIQDDISNKIFENILDQVRRDFSSSFAFGGSLLERILTDTQDNNQALHNLYKSWIFTRNKYHDSTTTQEQKGERFGFFGLDPTDHRGYYPETVGMYCKEQLESNQINYNSNVNIEEVTPETIFESFGINLQTIDLTIPKEMLEEPAFELAFEREYSGFGDFFSSKKVEGNISFISADLQTPEKNLSYKIKSSYDAEISYEDVSYNAVTSNGLDELNIENDENTEYRALVFNAFINKKFDSLINKPNISNIINFSSAIQNIFSNSMKLILDNTEGFQHGFEDETLTEEDLAYVNPEDGATEYTYDNKDKVLGRSRTNHPRITFLNPEQYGGSYKVPPIYIEPKKMHGWMKYSLDLFPEEEECEPKTQTIINSEKIKAFINKRRNIAPLKNQEMERMSEKCYFDKPFDKLLTKNALSSIEGLIKIQIRTSIIKEMIKSIPAISCLKYKSDNYDMSSSQTILNRLVGELKTVNPFGPYKLEKQNYYLIFLEQAVQYFISTTIAELPNKINPETGEETEEKDFSSLNSELENAYKKIKSFSDNFSYSNIIVPKAGGVQLLGSEDVDSSILSSDQYTRLAGAYQKVGDYIFNSDSMYDYGPDFLQNEVTTNLYSVIFAIRLCEKEAKVILKYLIDQEYEELMSDFYKKENAIIEDMSKAILTSAGLFEENEIQNFGFTQYEQKISVGSFQSMGQPNDVVDVTQIDPFSSIDEFKMKIEKYVRIHEKENAELPEEVMEILNSRDHNLKGVVSLENLQNFFNENMEALGDYNISDLFGNASINEDVMSGEIGLKTGIRIVARLPNVIPQAVDLRDFNFSKREKAYYIKNDSQIVSIPIASAEVEVIDVKIKDLNLEEIYDTDCLARKMTNSSDYKMFFMEIIPLPAASSMVLQYFNYFFLDSIGVAANERAESVSNPNRIKMPEFNDTNLQVRKYFACFYNTNRTLHSENFKLPKIEFPDFWKMLFGNISFPEININLILPDGLRFDHKIIKINPYNRNDEICNE